MPVDDRLLAPHAIEFDSEGGGVWIRSGAELCPVDRIVKCFPHSSPDAWVSFRDREGREIGLLERPEDLPEPARSRLRSVLRKRYHIPTILRIHDITRGPGGLTWSVDTEDGPIRFVTRSDGDISTSGFPCLVMTDPTDRRRYEIRDYRELDRSSRLAARKNLNILRRGRRGSRMH